MAKPNAIRPVIMSGGSGTRMWPLSRRAQPKQFHRFSLEQSLFQKTLLRLKKREAAFSAPIILGSADHETIIRRELEEISITPAQLIMEPMAKNTGPAIAALAYACEQSQPGDILVVLPADHVITDADGFAEALIAGAKHADGGHIVTFGVKPTRAETGYGYIQNGEALGDGAYRVGAFKEKPDLATAEKYFSSGDYSWNAGIFMFRSDILIAEIEKFRPQIAKAAADAVKRGAMDTDKLLLDADAFDKAPEESIDYAVMENTERAAVIAVDVGWSDVGSWTALWEVLEKDNAENAGAKDAILLDCARTLALSSGPKIAAIGVSDLAIIATEDGVLVTRKDMAQDVKKVVAALKETGRTDLT